MSKLIKVAIIGATGYTGIELVRLLINHPQIKICHLVSESNSGSQLEHIYPHLATVVKHSLASLNLSTIIPEIDVVFLAVPHGKAEAIAPEIIKMGKKVIDLSADFRLEKTLNVTNLGVNVVYSLPEITKHAAIKQAQLIANPGCYATASILGLAPAVANKLINLDNIIIDAKSGISGAGRGLRLPSHYTESNENFRAYQVGGTHRHIAEIEQELGRIANQKITLQFTPHLVPMTRGILATIYAKLNQSINIKDVFALYENYYSGKPFIRLYLNSEYPQTKNVSGSNYCDIHLYVDKRTHQLIIVSIIDNLIKGAVGQALQNLNINYGLPENLALTQLPVYP